MRKMLALMLLTLIQVGCSSTSTEPLSLRSEAADQIDSYARLARDSGQAARADELTADAEKLRGAERDFLEAQRAASEGRSYQGSTYLGFAPDHVLQEYAADLRARGRTGEADRAEALALRYREDQINAINATKEMMRQRSGAPGG